MKNHGWIIHCIKLEQPFLVNLNGLNERELRLFSSDVVTGWIIGKSLVDPYLWMTFMA